jgi:hypothetical protein
MQGVGVHAGCTGRTCRPLPASSVVVAPDDAFTGFWAGIDEGQHWHEGVAVAPDSLAGHPAVVRAPGPAPGGPLFYQEVSYAAGAFGQVTGDRDAFCTAWDRSPGGPWRSS